MKKNIFLIGPMGSGKSYLGKKLSILLNMNFYDSDNEIEKSVGFDINCIFKKKGELGLRKIEKIIIDNITKMKCIIFSTGGGSITSKNNANLLINRGLVIYLKVSILQQYFRTFFNKERPLLKKKIYF